MIEVERPQFLQIRKRVKARVRHACGTEIQCAHVGKTSKTLHTGVCNLRVAEFERRQRVDLSFARAVATVTAEDSILSKLEWARQSGDSARQLRDAAGVAELNPGLDRMYVRKWAEALGVADLWEQIVG